jgi:phosphoglycolate phosphatase-like HAD superfamily hydrolase
MSLRHVVLDFDGTCTRVEDVHASYVDACIRIFEAEVAAGTEKDLRAALAAVKKASPGLGWTLATTPAAPAFADPYIAMGEAVKLVVAKRRIVKAVPLDMHHRANDVAQAPWREEMVEVLEAFRKKKLAITFVSNSSTMKIERRLDDLLTGRSALRASIRVLGDAGKFRVREIESADVPAALRAKFTKLAVAEPLLIEGRPVYLRRGGYMEALAKVWQGKDLAHATLVCGDIWELDLAMPAVLGAHVFLVRRESPYATYAYEKRAIEALGARAAFGQLRDVLSRL